MRIVIAMEKTSSTDKPMRTEITIGEYTQFASALSEDDAEVFKKDLMHFLRNRWGLMAADCNCEACKCL